MMRYHPICVRMALIKNTRNNMCGRGCEEKGSLMHCFLFLFLFFNKFIYLFIFGCVGSLLLQAGFLWLRRAGATLRCGVQASHCSGFSCCGARALGVRASVVVAYGL